MRAFVFAMVMLFTFPLAAQSYRVGIPTGEVSVPWPEISIPRGEISIPYVPSTPRYCVRRYVVPVITVHYGACGPVYIRRLVIVEETYRTR